MSESDILKHFDGNWMFTVFKPRTVPPRRIRSRVLLQELVIPAWAAVVIFPFMIWCIGLLLAVVLGVGPTFTQGAAAYIGPLWIGLALLAYFWFTCYLPKTLATMDDALEDKVRYYAVIEKWGNRFKTWRFILLIVLFGILIAVLSYPFVDLLWHSDHVSTLLEGWVLDGQRDFFRAYFVANHTIILSILLSSGLITLLGSTAMLGELLRIPLKLTYYRRLRAISDLTIGIAFWTFLVIAFILAASIVLNYTSTTNPDGLGSIEAPAEILDTTAEAETEPTEAEIAALSAEVSETFTRLTLPLVLFASLALMVILFVPVWFARSAILHAKRAKHAIYEEQLHECSETIEHLIQEIEFRKLADTGGVNGIDQSLQAYDHLKDVREKIKAEMHEVDQVSALPITWLGLFQVIGSAIFPVTVGTVVNGLMSYVFT